MEERRTVDELVVILGDMIAEAWTMPLSGGKIVLERDRVLSVIDEIRTVMPGDLQQAKAIVESRNELAAAARRDADAIIRAAEDKARAMIAESVILREAQQAAKEVTTLAVAKAKETVVAAENQASQITSAAEKRAADIVRSAESKSSEMRSAVTNYLDNALARSEGSLTSALSEVHKARTLFSQINSSKQ